MARDPHLPLEGENPLSAVERIDEELEIARQTATW
jgi:hypothetical protein